VTSVHFIAVSEFLATHANSSWIHSDIRREVAFGDSAQSLITVGGSEPHAQ